MIILLAAIDDAKQGKEIRQEELDAIKNGDDIKSIDQDGHLVVFTNRKKYIKML